MQAEAIIICPISYVVEMELPSPTAFKTDINMVLGA